MLEIVSNATKLPWGAVRNVRRALAWINAGDLEGLSCIELVDKIPKPTDRAPQNIKNAFAEGYGIYGVYRRETKSGSPYITLLIGDIYRGLPPIYWWTTVPTLLITYTLAHEVGHHVVGKRGYVNEPGEKRRHEQYEEAFANRYAFAVQKKMNAKWYYKFGGWVIKNLAQWQYNMGIHAWNKHRYREAAEYWYIAWSLDPDLSEAANWYWRARELCESDQTSGRDVKIKIE